MTAFLMISHHFWTFPTKKETDCKNKYRSYFLLTENSNNILLKWQTQLDSNHEFIHLLKVLTGDLEAIEEVTG